jgi:hypothetical protein
MGREPAATAERICQIKSRPAAVCSGGVSATVSRDEFRDSVISRGTFVLLCCFLQSFFVADRKSLPGMRRRRWTRIALALL